MKLLRLGLLLVVMTGMIGVGSAVDLHTHLLTSSGKLSDGIFYKTYSVTDTVTTISSSQYNKMIFTVTKNGQPHSVSSEIPRVGNTYTYTIPNVDVDGNWVISVKEIKNPAQYELSEKGFTVVPPSYTHTLSSNGQVNTTFGQGAIIRDDVTSDYKYGTVMDFTWYYPDGSISKTATTSSTTGQYNDTLPSADVLNTWKVKAVEYDSGRQHSYTSEKTFAVTVPEFTFGSFISLSLAGGLFLVMRRKVQ